MANKFVWSGATGSNDGSSWDNAYTTLMRDWGAEGSFTPATDFIYVRSVHSESSGTDLVVTGSTGVTVAPCRILCVVGDTTGTTPGNLSTGASVTTTSTAAIKTQENLYIYGVNFYCNYYFYLGFGPEHQEQTLESCRMEIVGAGTLATIVGNYVTSAGSRMTFRACVFDFAGVGQGFNLRGGESLFVGGSVEYDVNNLITITVNSRHTTRFVGVDLSVLASSSLVLVTGVDTPSDITFSRCLLATGTTIASGNVDYAGTSIKSFHCQIGTDSDPAYQMEIHDSRGKVSANTAKYRTGGASDGVRSTPISWDVDTTVGSVRGYPGHAFECPPITAWTAGDGSTQHTYRVAFASDATINDDELWMELEGPNDAATNSLAALKTTRVAPRGTAAAYTTDSGSTWTGTGVGTKQYMQVQYTPDKPGPVTVRVMMAKASDNIYVDPMIQIDPA